MVRLYGTFASNSLSQEFEAIHLYRTFSNHVLAELTRCVAFFHKRSGWWWCRTFPPYLFTGEARCTGCFSTSSRWFKHIEPPRTFSLHSTAETGRRVTCFYRHADWFLEGSGWRKGEGERRRKRGEGGRRA